MLVDERHGFLYVAGHQVPVAVEGDLNARVPEIAAQRLGIHAGVGARQHMRSRGFRAMERSLCTFDERPANQPFEERGGFKLALRIYAPTQKARGGSWEPLPVE